MYWHSQPEQCSVHCQSKRAEYGFCAAFNKLAQSLPGCTIFSQVPCWTVCMNNSTQCRNCERGTFMTQHDVQCDMLVRSPEGLCYAVEVQDPGHGSRREAKDKRDAKKRAFAQAMSLPLAEFWLYKCKKLNSAQWDTEIENVQAYFCMGNICSAPRPCGCHNARPPRRVVHASARPCVPADLAFQSSSDLWHSLTCKCSMSVWHKHDE